MNVQKPRKIGGKVINDADIPTPNEVVTFDGDSDQWISTNNPLFVVKAADETINNSITMQDDDELKATLKIDQIYMFRLVLFYISNSTADFKLEFTAPAGATGGYVDEAGKVNDMLAFGTDIFSSVGSGEALSIYYGRVVMGATAGDLQLRWAQNTATVVDTKVLAGSTLEIHKA